MGNPTNEAQEVWRQLRRRKTAWHISSVTHRIASKIKDMISLPIERRSYTLLASGQRRKRRNVAFSPIVMSWGVNTSATRKSLYSVSRSKGSY
jgi:hypothetical protein